MEKYWKHLNNCNKAQDWTDAQEALSLCPDGPDKEAAYEEMRQKMNTCTCGMESTLKTIKESIFTPEQITQVQALAYDAGLKAAEN